MNLINLPTNPILHRGDSRVRPMYEGGSGSIIIDHDVLGEKYIPSRLKARETQSEQIMCCLSPVINRHKPIHAWLYGKAGTGKTSTAMHLLRQLEERNSIKSICINCFERNTFYEILNTMIWEKGIRSFRT